MERKLKRIVLWLKKIYGNQPIPKYEVNARTVDILYELVERTESRERDVSLLIEDMKEKAMEYEAKANYLQDLLIESLGLSITSLSSKGFRCLNTLVNSALILETKDTSLTSFFCAIYHMTSELYAARSENRKLEVELNSITKKLNAMLRLEKQLEEDLKKSEESIVMDTIKADRQIHSLKFLENKSKDMTLRIKAAEEQLAATGLDQSLTHESLVNLSDELAELQNEVMPLKRKLELFLDLSPAVSVDTAHCAEVGALNRILMMMKKYPKSPTLAQVRIEEVKRELDALEVELSKEVEQFALELPDPSKL